MSGRHRIPLAKALLESVMSSSQKKKGIRKRLLDTRVMDDPEAYKLSKAKATSTPAATQDGTPPASTFVEPSPAKFAKKVRSKSS